MKILYIATIGGFMPFFKSLIRKLLDDGHEVDIAANTETTPIPEYYEEWGCKLFSLSCSRSPINRGNLDAIKEIQSIVSTQKYDIVHCHTPIAAACTRIACRKARKEGTKVIYTAHGFHFYSGAPKKNWLIFYPVEKICSKWTDVLITINKEDYSRAKAKFHAKRIEYVPGVGIDVNRFFCDSTDKIAKRKELGLPENACILFSVGELNENKNHQVIIRALSKLPVENTHYVIAGKGANNEKLISLANELGVGERFHLLGYRNDISELYKMADIFILPSIREGLNVSIMEAMSSGLPCVVSDIRGNRDLIDDKEGGFLVSTMEIDSYVKAIISIIKNPKPFVEHNVLKAKNYEQEQINNKIEELYYEIMQ